MVIRSVRYCDFCNEPVKDANDALQISYMTHTYDICLKCSNNRSVLDIKRYHEDLERSHAPKT